MVCSESLAASFETLKKKKQQLFIKKVFEIGNVFFFVSDPHMVRGGV